MGYGTLDSYIKAATGATFDYTIHIVDKISRHPDALGHKNDIALLRLRRPLKWTERVKPLCLPSEPVAEGDTCVVTGWGQNPLGKFSLD